MRSRENEMFNNDETSENNNVYTLARYMNNFYTRTINHNLHFNCKYIFQYLADKQNYQIKLYKLDYINLNIIFDNIKDFQNVSKEINDLQFEHKIDNIIINEIYETENNDTKMIYNIYINSWEFLNDSDYIIFIKKLLCILENSNVINNDFYNDVMQSYSNKEKTYTKLNNLYLSNIDSNKEFIFFDIIRFNKYKHPVNYNIYRKFKVLIYKDDNFQDNISQINSYLYDIYINYNTKYLCYT